MSSELAVVTAEIVDILPKKHQTLANQEWIESELKNNSIQEVLDAIQQHFNVSNGKIASCEKRLDKLDVKLDQHIIYVDQKFAAVDSRVSQLERDLAVTKAVNDERANTHQFLTGQMMNSINSTNQNVVNASAKSNRPMVYPDPTIWCLGAAMMLTVLGVFLSVVRVEKRPEPSTRSQASQAETYQCDKSMVANGKVNFAGCNKKFGNEI